MEDVGPSTYPFEHVAFRPIFLWELLKSTSPSLSWRLSGVSGAGLRAFGESGRRFGV